MKSRMPSFAVFAVLALTLIGGCASNKNVSQGTQETDWTIVGSWVNASYDTAEDFPSKAVYTDKGGIELYRHLRDKTPSSNLGVSTGTFTIERSWTESGIHWFNVKCSFGDAVIFQIVKLTSNGSKFESVSSLGGKYPASFDTSSTDYYYETRSREK